MATVHGTNWITFTWKQRIWESSRWIVWTWDSDWLIFLFSVKSRQKFFCKTKKRRSHEWSNYFEAVHSFNELNRFHRKTKWVNSVRKQDFCVLLKLDNILWPRTLVILDNIDQWLVANTLHLEMIQLLNQKDGFKEIWGLDLYWKSQPVIFLVNMEFKLWIKTILNFGSEFPMERSNTMTARLRASRHSRNCPQWSHRCWKCACSRTHFFVTICHSYLFVNFCIRRYCIYTNRDPWWIWPQERLRSCLLQFHQTRGDFVLISRSWEICSKWR